MFGGRVVPRGGSAKPFERPAVEAALFVRVGIDRGLGEAETRRSVAEQASGGACAPGLACLLPAHKRRIAQSFGGLRPVHPRLDHRVQRDGVGVVHAVADQPLDRQGAAQCGHRLAQIQVDHQPAVMHAEVFELDLRGAPCQRAPAVAADDPAGPRDPRHSARHIAPAQRAVLDPLDLRTEPDRDVVVARQPVAQRGLKCGLKEPPARMPGLRTLDLRARPVDQQPPVLVHEAHTAIDHCRGGDRLGEADRLEYPQHLVVEMPGARQVVDRPLALEAADGEARHPQQVGKRGPDRTQAHQGDIATRRRRVHAKADPSAATIRAVASRADSVSDQKKKPCGQPS